jgi:hypothetical protein
VLCSTQICTINKDNARPESTLILQNGQNFTFTSVRGEAVVYKPGHKRKYGWLTASTCNPGSRRSVVSRLSGRSVVGEVKSADGKGEAEVLQFQGRV